MSGVIASNITMDCNGPRSSAGARSGAMCSLSLRLINMRIVTELRVYWNQAPDH